MPVALVLTAHGDDMEFFAGGTIAKLCALGYQVHLVMATDNAKGTFELSAAQMVGLRLQEAEAAGRVLGLASVACLDYPDGDLIEVPHTRLRGQFMGHIRARRPDIVFTFDPFAPYENHPDHRTVSWTATEAAGFASFPLYYPEQLQAGLEPCYVPEVYHFAKSPIDVNRSVDITGDPIAKKIEALYCYDSQMVLTLADAQMAVNAAPFDIPDISALDPHDYRGFIDRRVRGTAAAIGRKYGFEYAEHFRRTRWGGLERRSPTELPPEPF
ncbi:MAG: PIG-L family deacetylase [Dehalococcoidia bacterium]